MRWLLQKARKRLPEGRTVLDIGAGTGLLVAEARADGLDAVGVEPSHSLVEVARRENGIELLQGTFPHAQLAGRTFDFIFLVDVIEHVCNPLELLQECARALEENGIIIVVTPDVRSVAACILRKRWWHFRLAHVGYFSEKSASVLAERSGTAIVDRFRAKWFFRVGYLADRVARYLPVAALNRAATKVPAVRSAYDWLMPLDLRDSWVFFLGRIDRCSR